MSHFKIFKSRTKIAYITGIWGLVTTVAIGSPLTSPDGKHIAFNKAITDTTVTRLEQF